MKNLLISCTVIVLSLMLTACNTTERKDLGLVAGGVTGGVAGNVLTGGSAAGTIVGAVGGAYVGRELSH